MPKVIVGMSGGVDSSVTACLLREEGLEVEGVSFVLWEARNRSDFTACCSLEATQAAAKTAEQLGIRHSSVDVRDEFIQKVIEPFVDSYVKGFTPNPCILCNRHIKFPSLLREAEKRGADFIATGHYAQTSGNYASKDGTASLRKGIDPGKDQSYVLYALRHEELRRLLLPLGVHFKKDIRAMARSLGLAAADRPESQEICFIEDGDYAGFVEKLSPSSCRPGPILGPGGEKFGIHKGICHYTIGQRKGLGIASPDPFYVTEIDAEENAIHIGSLDDAKTKEVVVCNLHWIAVPPGGSFRATVKVRSMMKDRPASVEIAGGRATVLFDEPQFAPAPGQSAVFYKGDSVLGGGIIASSGTERPINR